MRSHIHWTWEGNWMTRLHSKTSTSIILWYWCFIVFLILKWRKFICYCIQLDVIQSIYCYAFRWGDIEFPLPFGRVLSPTESFIHSLDDKVFYLYLCGHYLINACNFFLSMPWGKNCFLFFKLLHLETLADASSGFRRKMTSQQGSLCRHFFRKMHAREQPLHDLTWRI